LVEPILSQNLWQKISKTVESVDEYVKKLKTVQLVQLVMNAEMKQYTSLKEISNSLNNDAFAKALHLESISTSQISRRFREMSTYHGSLLDIQRLLKTCLYESSTPLVQKLHNSGNPTEKF